MERSRAGVGVLALLLVGAARAPSSPAPVASLRSAFASPSDDSRILMRWWWFGPAVTPAELERELRLMKDAGIGGVEIQPVYPLSPDDPQRGIVNLPFLSAAFLNALRVANDAARSLGLRVDVTLGSGWPYGGATVPVTQAARTLRVVRMPISSSSARLQLPAVGPGEELLAVFVHAPDADGAEDVTANAADGVLRLTGMPAPREALVFVAGRTGMMVKRAAVGAEGYVLDHYDRAALDAYLRDVGAPLLRAFGDAPPYAIFCDSLEAYESNWAGDLLPEFAKRRGYDLREHLVALALDRPDSVAVRHDWTRTLAELYEERFARPLQAWAHAQGTRLRIQDYGVPPATIASAAAVDLPEGEGSDWRRLTATRWASSAAHVADRPVVSSETWTWLHSPAFRASPLDMKAEADRHFLEGVNQLVGHGWPYTPPGGPDPGWRFYAAGAFDERNPWWIAMPDVARYLQRVSFVLRQGEPVADIAVYLPNADAFARYAVGRTPSLVEALSECVGPALPGRILDAGFGFDFFDDDLLRRVGSIADGRLRLGPRAYRAVVLPYVERMPVDTARALEHAAASGVVVVAVGRPPGLAPGWLEERVDGAEVRSISGRLFDDPRPAGRLARDEAELALALGVIAPDVAVDPPSSDVGFVHRRGAGFDAYFLANTGNTPRAITLSLRDVAGGGAEWWDPMTGAAAPAALRIQDGRAVAEVRLEAYGSRVLVTSLDLPTAPAPAATHRDVVELRGEWRLGLGTLPPQALTAELRSWTQAEATVYFSGVGRYERELVLEQPPPAAGRQRLELGDSRPIDPNPAAHGMQAWLDAPVREAAVVWINGRRAGSAWCPPYAVDVTGLLHAGRNTIAIDVGNLAINAMAGVARPDQRLLDSRYGRRFEPQDMDGLAPVPSGLLGPIRLVTETP